MSVAVKPVIYQLVVRYFGNTNTTNRRDGTLAVNGCGTFADVRDTALRELKALGATHLWLTGCLRQATLTPYPQLGLPADDPDVVKGVAGSFYAVRDYFDVCPDYARDPANRLAEFDALVGRAHAAGLKVLLDFVPNHVARGYHSVVRPDLDFGAGDDQTQFFNRDNHFFYLTDPPGQALRLSRPPSWNPPGFVFDGLYPPEDGGPGHVPRASGDNC
ncbi:MAG TPA: alpha-amylase family glycosyl hydrolase, partial [Gemmataceae bacterium]|nr:alpha-amylase family glycosyl hydrolase [Gemmataceae bacterium]